MTDIDPQQVEKPVIFDASPTKAVMGTVIAAMLIVITSFSTLLSLMQARDVVALLRWFQGTEGVSFAASISLLGTVGWRVWVSIRKHAKAVLAAKAAPNRIAIVRDAKP